MDESPSNVNDGRGSALDSHGGAALLIDLVRALRPQQWVKNLLIFVPLVLAHRLSSPSAVAATTWALIAFQRLRSRLLAERYLGS